MNHNYEDHDAMPLGTCLLVFVALLVIFPIGAAIGIGIAKIIIWIVP